MVLITPIILFTYNFNHKHLIINVWQEVHERYCLSHQIRVVIPDKLLKFLR